MNRLNELISLLNLEIQSSKIKISSDSKKTNNNYALSTNISFPCPNSNCGETIFIETLNTCIECKYCKVTILIIQCQHCKSSYLSHPIDKFLCKKCNHSYNIMVCSNCYTINYGTMKHKLCISCSNSLAISPFIVNNVVKKVLISTVLFLYYYINKNQSITIERLLTAIKLNIHSDEKILEVFKNNYSELKSNSENLEIMHELKEDLKSNDKSMVLHLSLKIISSLGDLNENDIEYILYWFSLIGITKYEVYQFINEYFFVINFAEDIIDEQLNRIPEILRKYIFILGVTGEYTKDNIKKTFYENAKKYHPDKVRHLDESERILAEKIFKEKQQAYEILSKNIN